MALAAVAFGRGDDAVGIRLHAAVRPHWPVLTIMTGLRPLDTYQHIVDARRALDPAIFRKLGVRTRSEATAVALRNHLLDPSETDGPG